MGITQLSLDRINRYIQPKSKMFIVGCQNLYNADNYMEIAHPYFEDKGHKVRSIDILGCNGSEVADLREDLKLEAVYDIVNDCGSKEHVAGGLYQPFKNIHEACKIGGVMIHENPKTGNWPGHGQHYFTEEFYTALAEALNYEVLELTREAAMSNVIDGWNISCVLKKQQHYFITELEFNRIYEQYIKSK